MRELNLLKELYYPYHPVRKLKSEIVSYKEFAPKPSLQPYIFHYWEMKTRGQLQTDFLHKVVPNCKIFDQNQHVLRLRMINNEIKNCIETFDFMKKCESYPMPPFGHMSVFEWLTFTVCHIHLKLMRTVLAGSR